MDRSKKFTNKSDTFSTNTLHEAMSSILRKNNVSFYFLGVLSHEKSNFSMISSDYDDTYSCELYTYLSSMIQRKPVRYDIFRFYDKRIIEIGKFDNDHDMIYLIFITQNNNIHIDENDLSLLKLSILEDIIDHDFVYYYSLNNNNKYVQEIYSFSFASYNYSDFDLLFFVLLIFYRSGLHKLYDVNHHDLKKFFVEIREGYKNVPYHNWVHAVDIYQFIFYFLESNKATIFNNEEVLCLLIAAIAHDIGHNGFTNDFHIKTESYYYVQSGPRNPPLEYHHFKTLLRIILKYPFVEQLKEMKCLNMIKQMILSTDMSKHSQFMSLFKRLANDTAGKLHMSHKNEELRLLLCQLLIKTADLSNTTREFKHAELMAKRLKDEWLAQGDVEKDMGLEVTPPFDREKSSSFYGDQIHFYSDVAVDLFTYFDLIFGCNYTDLVRLNMSMYSKMKNGSF